MVILAGGAMFMDSKRVNGGLHERMDGFVNLTWHGAHGPGVGDYRNIFASVDVARDCHGGQLEIYFCSTACLRLFFNSWVGALEAKIRRAKRQKSKR